MRLEIWDLDGSLVEQAPIIDAVRNGACVMPLRHVGRSLRLWAPTPSIEEAAMICAGLMVQPRDETTVFLLGCGDFHHLAALLVGTAHLPLTVLHVDNHADCCRCGSAWQSGAWIDQILDMAHVERVLTIGPCSGALHWPHSQDAGLTAVLDGRLRIFPWRELMPRRAGTLHDRSILWRAIGRDWPGFLDELSEHIVTDAVWLSIDKDVLRPSDALTNWEQGDMPLSALTDLIRHVAGHHRIAGVDICGEYAPAERIAWCGRSVPPAEPPQALAHPGLWRNARANAVLLQTLGEVCQ